MQRFSSVLQKVEGLDSSVLVKIEHEILLLLEEQMIKNNCDVLVVFEQNKDLMNESGHTLDFIIKKHMVLGKSYIEYMLNLKKKKSRVDLEEIKEYINRNFTDSHLSLEILANKFFVSKEYLSKAFKSMYKCNITEYIVGQRMEHARQLLEDNELQIKSIAAMVGYEDVTYFYRVFKKYYKISPGEMRQG
jgi:two-component system, response regulator YesN